MNELCCRRLCVWGCDVWVASLGALINGTLDGTLIGRTSCYSDNPHFQSIYATNSNSHSLKHRLWPRSSISFLPRWLLQRLSFSISSINAAGPIIYRLCSQSHSFLLFAFGDVCSAAMMSLINELDHALWALRIHNVFIVNKIHNIKAMTLSLLCFNKSPAASARRCHLKF